MNKLISEQNYKDLNVLIVGDVMLDRYYYGQVSRISPEAPVPVINVVDEKSTLGGAGNVVNNVRGLTANCSLIGSAAKDHDGLILENMFKHINADYNFIDTSMPTISKLRVIGSKQQICRLDFENVKEFTKSIKEEIINTFKNRINNSQIVVISDYGKGICSEEVCSAVINTTIEKNKMVVVDPKGSNWDKYKNATIVTPNVKELSEVVGKNILNTDEEVIKYGKIIREKYNLKYLVVTRSEKGITIIGNNEFVKTIPTEAREVFDVSGAGDTVVACLAVFLGLNMDIEEAVILANHGAGVVVGKLGTAPITLSELEFSAEGIHSSKIIPRNFITDIVSRERRFNKTIVFTNGCFDILHIGHVTYLKKAKSLGDILILGLNSDDSVKRLKGDSRPINSEKDRAGILEALEFIDYIVIFNEDTPYDLIKAIQPDILVKGGDYKAEDVVGREFSKKVEIIDFVDGYSTTNTINKINNK